MTTNNNNTTNEYHDDAHYHEEVTYDSKKEQWSGLLGLLMIPLFLFVVGYGFFSVFRMPSDTADSGEVNGIERGIGGGFELNPTPHSSPVPTIHEGESLDIIQ